MKKDQQIYWYVDQMWNLWVSLEPQVDVLVQNQIEVTSKRLEELFEDNTNFIWDLENIKEFENVIDLLAKDYPNLAFKIMLIKNMILDL